MVLLAACPAPRQYAVRRTDVECERAARLVRRTLLTLGYTVTAMVEPSAAGPGMVAGSKTLPDGTVQTGTVRIRCTPAGVEVQPVEGDLVPSDYQFSRAFRYSYISLAQRPDVETPRVAAGLQVLVEVLDAFAQRLDLGSPVVAEDVVLVRLTVRNDSERPVTLAPEDFALARPDGETALPLGPGEAEGRLVPGPGAERVRDELLRRMTIGPGRTLVRFALFPAGEYREARIGITDADTDEVEGFFVPVQ